MALEFDCSVSGLDDYDIACRHDALNTSQYRSRNHTIKKGFRTVKFHHMVLNGKDHVAYHDNQSTVNILSHEFARRHKLSFSNPTDDFQVLLADNTTAKSIGRVKVKAELGSFYGEVEFHVLKFSLFPVIVGRNLLASASLLSEKIEADARNPLRSECRIRIKDRTGREYEAVAILHQGSHKNIMSLSYAQSHNHVSPEDGIGDSSSTLEDARYATLGTRKIVENCMTAKARLFRRSRNPLRGLVSEKEVKFIILKNFPFDVALGNKFLEGQNLPAMSLSPIAEAEAAEHHGILLPVRCFKQEERRYFRRSKEAANPVEALHLPRPARSYT